MNPDFQPSGFPLSSYPQPYSVNTGNGPVCISWRWFPSILLAEKKGKFTRRRKCKKAARDVVLSTVT